MNNWSAVLVLWLFFWLELGATSSSPAHIIGENLLAHDVIGQIEDRLDIRIAIDVEDHYGFRKDYDHWVTLDQFFLSLVKYYKIYNGVELFVEKGKRGRYHLKAVRAERASGANKGRLKSRAKKRASSAKESPEFLKPMLVDLNLADSDGDVSEKAGPVNGTELMIAKSERENLVEFSPHGLLHNKVLGENHYPSLVIDDLEDPVENNIPIKKKSELGNFLAVEVIGFKMAIPSLPETPSLFVEEEVKPEFAERNFSLARYGLSAPRRPLLGHLRGVPILGSQAPSIGEDDIQITLSRSVENRRSQSESSDLDSTVMGASVSRALSRRLWLSAGVELEKLDWTLDFKGASLDRDRTWIRGVDLAFHYDLPLEEPGYEVRTSMTSRLPALWENDDWMSHQLQFGFHLGVKKTASIDQSFLFQLNIQSLPDLRTQALPMDSLVTSLDLGWEWLSELGLWGLTAHLQRDPVGDLRFANPLTFGIHWGNLDPELPYGAALYFAAVEGGLEGQLSLTWNLKK